MKDIHSNEVPPTNASEDITSTNENEELSPPSLSDTWYKPHYGGENYTECTGNRINDLRMCLKFLSNGRLLLNAPSPDYLPPEDLHPLTAEFDRLYDIIEEEMFDWNGNTGDMARARKKKNAEIDKQNAEQSD